ncbi:LysR family transcriptional regulator [uncultured Pseudoteredinibacter sp.]|uniref:LysR family transcriptional regulator n=1 Tax=uncultured Pseudoteredinibacter sp. TaxID=1641701 RepID=UPI00262079EF|nr:LysR family transcriptional regulator [uncultured Pseudoteredinibacter sp.]
MNTEDLNIAIMVAELGSITAAAKRLDLRNATANAALKRLEKQLGVELFIRTTRSLRLSQAGEQFIPQCKHALSILEGAKLQGSNTSELISGELKLAVSSDFGRNLLLPWLDLFVERHPKLSLNLSIDDRQVDFYRDGVDIAIRYGSPKDSSVYGFKLCDVPGLLCASPDYLKQYGEPRSLDELKQHNALLYQLHGLSHDLWEFTHQGSSHRLRMHSNHMCNDGDIVRRWCIAAKGIAVKSSLDMANDLIAGRLKVIMEDYRPPVKELWLICPSRQLITPAVRALRDDLRNHCTQLLSQLKENGFLKAYNGLEAT